MKNLLVILFLFVYVINYAQNKFPSILNFEVAKKKTNDEGNTKGLKDTYHFLMITPHKAVDLKNYVNENCEFKIIGNNRNRIILEFHHPSKQVPKGRCAAGLEKGYLYLELDTHADVIKSKTYLIESCLWSIELINTLNEDSDIITYMCENLHSSETFTLSVDTKSAVIVKEEKQD